MPVSCRLSTLCRSVMSREEAREHGEGWEVFILDGHVIPTETGHSYEILVLFSKEGKSLYRIFRIGEELAMISHQTDKKDHRTLLRPVKMGSLTKKRPEFSSSNAELPIAENQLDNNQLPPKAPSLQNTLASA